MSKPYTEENSMKDSKPPLKSGLLLSHSDVSIQANFEKENRLLNDETQGIETSKNSSLFSKKRQNLLLIIKISWIKNVLLSQNVV